VKARKYYNTISSPLYLYFSGKGHKKVLIYTDVEIFVVSMWAGFLLLRITIGGFKTLIL